VVGCVFVSESDVRRFNGSIWKFNSLIRFFCMIHPDYKERAASLTKAVKSLATVAIFAMIGFAVGLILGGYYLVPTIKAGVVQPVPHCAFGDPAFAAALGGSFLGTIAGSVFGAFIARSLWWPKASWMLVLILVTIALGLFAILIG
jgi:hypothetical protein